MGTAPSCGSLSFFLLDFSESLVPLSLWDGYNREKNDAGGDMTLVLMLVEDSALALIIKF